MYVIERNMQTKNIINVFLPNEFLNKTDFSYLFGTYHSSLSSVSINCILSVESKTKLCTNEIKAACKNCEHFDKVARYHFVGVLYHASNDETFEKELFQYTDIFIQLRVDPSSSFHLDCSANNFKILKSQLVLYSNSDFLCSELYLNRIINICHENNALTHFLINLQPCKRLHQNTSERIYLDENSHGHLFSFDDQLFFYPMLMFSSLLLHFSRFFECFLLFSSWSSEVFVKALKLTHVGCQIHQRFIHCRKIFTVGDKFSTREKNLLSAICLDLIFGWIMTYYLLHSNRSEKLMSLTLEETNNIVNGLQKLIYWLMGVPAGLKLNIPLNHVLGHFFLYHIYLWEAYMTVVLPIFSFVFKSSSVIGLLGGTFIFSLFNDLISLTTVHIYCFYGYATRLYGYQISSLSALWRLFRGRKLNPLRLRVDSCKYDMHQLFIGTLIFTVLIFLLPTVMIYYLVFTCLRIMVLLIQGLVSKLTNAMTVLPIYAIIYRIFCSPKMAGNIHFTVYNTKSTLVLYMQNIQIPVLDVVKATVPELYKTEEYLTWRNFFSCIVWGKIIYPL